MTPVCMMGPTAAGKAAQAMQIAARMSCEIGSVDSMQLYRGMDIGTAKLTPGERAGLPHHLLDIWDVTTAANAAEYQQLARAAIADIHGRGKIPVLGGGSGRQGRAGSDQTGRAEARERGVSRGGAGAARVGSGAGIEGLEPRGASGRATR